MILLTLALTLALVTSNPLSASVDAESAWMEGTVMPTARAESSAVALNDSIYIIGGGDVFNSKYVIIKERNLGMTDAVEIYYPVNDTWHNSTALPEPLDHAVAAAYEGKLYVVGGFDVDRNPTGKLYIYDPMTRNWKEGKPMPTPRGASSGGFINGLLYVVGGMKNHEGDKDEGPLTANEAYDPHTDMWTKKSPMPTPRHHHEAVIYDNKMYVLGGRMTGLQSNLNSNEVYDPVHDSWRIGDAIPLRISGFSAVEINGSIYIFGGEGPLLQALKDIMQYKPESDRWIKQYPSISNLQVPTPRMGLAGLRIDNSVYLIGGKEGPYKPATGLNEIFNFPSHRNITK